MKILFCPHNYPPTPGGVSTFSYGIVESLRQKGYEVIVIYDSSQVPKSKRKLGVNYLFNVDVRYVKKLIKTFQILWACGFYKPDIIFCTEWKTSGIGALLANKLFKVKYFVQVHGTEILKIRRMTLAYYLSKLVFRNTQGIVPNSRYTANLLSFLSCDEKKIHIFNPGIFPVEVTKPNTLPISDDKVVFFTAARLINRKGIDLCIEALAEVSNQNWLYYIAGDGPSKKALMEIVKTKHLGNQIKFLGMIDQAEIHNYMAACDVFLATSRSMADSLESFGIVYLEANMQGKPVIAASVGGVPDAVVDGVTGYLIAENNKDQLIDRINILMSDKQLRTHLGKQGKERVVNHFLWHNHIDRLIKILQLD
jgi:phosphatidyl-myo-inositol dimannoside synthase